MPDAVARWTIRAQWLRRLDALIAGIAAWGLVAGLADSPPLAQALVAAALVVALERVPLIRLGWRPVSGLVGLGLSRSLAAGHRAWYVRPGATELVIVTARRGLRLTIAAPGRTLAEGMTVRRTRVLLLSADERAR
jgi:hypothetical protein